jgi:uncharacterized membrane protein (DUF4010 family)
MANAVQGPRLLVLIWVVSRLLGYSLAVPLVGMGLAGLVGSWLLSRKTVSDPDVEFTFENPYSLTPALKFGAFFVAVLFLVNGASAWFGETGTLAAAAIAGLGSASAAALSVAGLVSADELTLGPASLAIFLAVGVNSVTKWILSLINGTREMALWLGAGLVSMLAAGVLLYLFTVGLFL